MRITEDERQAIISSIIKYDEKAEIHLFGSRLDDSKKGGDIDILIKSDVISKKTLFLIEEEMFRQIEEQKLDFVLTGYDVRNSFARMVLAHGTVKLWEKKKSNI